MTTATKAAVLEFADAGATETSLTGGKAAALARASAAGLPTLGGVVLTTLFSQEIDAGADLASSGRVSVGDDPGGRTT